MPRLCDYSEPYPDTYPESGSSSSHRDQLPSFFLDDTSTEASSCCNAAVEAPKTPTPSIWQGERGSVIGVVIFFIILLLIVGGVWWYNNRSQTPAQADSTPDCENEEDNDGVQLAEISQDAVLPMGSMPKKTRSFATLK